MGTACSWSGFESIWKLFCRYIEYYWRARFIFQFFSVCQIFIFPWALCVCVCEFAFLTKAMPNQLWYLPKYLITTNMIESMYTASKLLCSGRCLIKKIVKIISKRRIRIRDAALNKGYEDAILSFASSDKFEHAKIRNEFRLIPAFKCRWQKNYME